MVYKPIKIKKYYVTINDIIIYCYIIYEFLIIDFSYVLIFKWKGPSERNVSDGLN